MVMDTNPAPKLLDPRNEREVFLDVPVSAFFNNGLLHVALAVDRPPLGAQPGAAMVIEREIVCRLVMPAATALSLAELLQKSASASTQPAKPTSN
jgi:hypothetical protein